MCVHMTEHVNTGITWPYVGVLINVHGVMGPSTYVCVCLLDDPITAISLHESMLKLTNWLRSSAKLSPVVKT